MLTQPFILLGILSIRVYANTVVNEDKKLNQSDVVKENVNLDSTLDPLVDTITNEKDNLAQTQRQKRNGYNYNQPLYNPFQSYLRRDDYPESGGYEDGNKLGEISKRLKDLMITVNNRAYIPPRPSIQPVLIPIYVASMRCLCNTVTQEPSSTTTIKPQPKPTNPPTRHPDSSTSAVPDFTSRVGEDDDNDGARPVSFVPIPPKKPLNRESPPVEHGTVQAGAGPIVSGRFPSKVIPDEPKEKPNNTPTELTLSQCDKAVRKCCFQPRITYACFKSEKCPEPPFRASLCETDVLSNVLNKYIKVLEEKGVQ